MNNTTHLTHCLWVALCSLALVASACGDDGASSAGNLPPEFLDVPTELRINANETTTINVAAKDPEGDDFTLTMEEGPSTADFVVSGFGRFVWTPGAEDATEESHTVIFAAEDSSGARTTFRMEIFVAASEGVTLFVTSNSRVLDLTRNDTLIARVGVQRDDVAEVDLSIDNAPDGMELSQEGGKSAEIRWKPTENQITSKLIWGATIKADAGDGSDPATQNLTLTLVAKGCGEGSTQIQHAPLEDQRNAGSYAIEADISHPDGDDVRATLFWRIGGDPNDSGGFEGVDMEKTSGNTYRGTVPNPEATAGEPQDVYYFVVGVSDADRNLGCLARAPASGLNSFSAFAPGDDSCRRDNFEPNDGFSSAADLDEETQGVSLASGQLEVYGLAICPGDTDIFAIDLEENQGVTVLTTYNGDNGSLHLRGFGPNEALILESSDMFANESSMLLPAATAGRYFIEVSGDPQGYRMYLSLRDDVDPDCIDNQFEPNDFPTSAPIIPAGTYEGLQVCPGDKDYYGIRVPQDHTLTVQMLFAHSDGDLDLSLRDRNESVVAQAGSSSDNEELTFHNPRGGESFTLEVRAVNGAVAPYSLIITVEEQDVSACSNDFFEPNDNFEEAAAIAIDGNLDNSQVTMCGDDDYYAVEVQAGQTISADILFDNSVADLDMEIFDPQFESKAFSAGTDNQEATSWLAEQTGLHYVHVIRFSDMGTLDYQISISTDGDGPGDLVCTDDSNEENGARPLATLLADSQTSRVGLCASDLDYYVVDLQGGQGLLAILSATAVAGGDPTADIRIDVVNSDEEVLTAGSVSGDSIELIHNAVNSGFVFLRVTNTNSSGSGYIYDLDTIVE